MTENIVDLAIWKHGDKELARLDRGELSSLLTQQADELAQLLDKAKEAHGRLEAIKAALDAKHALSATQARSYALFADPLHGHLVGAHDFAWNLVMYGRDL
ncbi:MULTISPECIES: hypothetical protein [unclassified Rhizobium]|uniref:hypothetical protein n=1 Tax=unclassified Rhizobium TaxID=2613769 RepID=UPI0007EB4495|nr:MULTISPECIES: hypothetical protein [unclassified Rhizobium]ANL12034.1 hypothetical protein AMJ98_PA00088 [Rhizobium sp. N1341]ANM42879.1 hypothetical protein AMK03_PA00088 [Rhizobium sp. N741]